MEFLQVVVCVIPSHYHEPKLTAGVRRGAACKPIKIPEHVRDKLLGGGIPEHWFVDEPVEGWDGCHPNHVCRN